LDGLAPTEQLWVIALAMEENGAPLAYIAVLWALADRLEELGWWLAEPLDCALEGPAGPSSRVPRTAPQSSIPGDLGPCA
jgi:hypothetical protein